MLLATALAGAVWACGGGSTPAVDLAMEEQNVRARSAEFLRAAQAYDHAGATAVFAPDGEVLEPNGPAHRGSAALLTFSQRMGGLPNFQVSWEPTEVMVAQAGDVAVERGTYQLSFDGPDGRVEDNGKYVIVWLKQNGQWMVKYDIFNSSVPMPGM
jgi:ketosteroid isomerase-like protein